MVNKEHIYILLLVIVSSFLFFYRLGDLPLMDPDEPRYAEVAREMRESGNLFIPHFNYEYRLNKPPLYYWLIYLSYFIWGINEFAVRFPSAIFAVGGVFITFLLGSEFYNSRFIGLLAGLILATSWEYLLIARMAIIDMVLSFFVLSTILFFIKFKKDKKRIYLYLMWISMAFAFLSKGPVGGLIPILFFLFFCLLDKKINLFKEIFRIPPVLIFLLISLSWYCFILVKLGFQQGLILFRQETLERFTKGYIHRESFFYYFGVILAGFMPWTVFLPWVRINLKSGKIIVSWIIGVLLFFSLCKSKVATYILPLFPALSLVLANFWQEAFWGRIRNISARVFFSLLLFLLIIAFSFLWVSSFILKEYDINLNPRLITTFSINIVIIAFALYSASRKKIKTVFFSLICFALYLIILFYGLFAADLGKVRSAKSLIYPIIKKVKPADSIVAYKFKKPSLVFYSRHKVSFVNEPELLMEYLNNGERRLFLALKDIDFNEIKDKYNFQVESRSRGYLIVRRDKISP